MKKLYRRKIPKRRFYHRGKRCSKGEKTIAKLLDSQYIEYEMEKMFDNCKSLSGRPLRFDFYLPEYNVCIEFQGHHHYNPVNKYRAAKITHEKTLIHDKIKRNWTFHNGIYLVEIPHWNIEIFEQPLLKYLQHLITENVGS